MSNNLDAALRTIDEYLDNPTQRAGDDAYPSERGDGSAGQCWRCRRNPTDDPAALCEGCRAFMLEDTDEDPAADPRRIIVHTVEIEQGPPAAWLDVDPGMPVRLPADTRRPDLYTITPANRRLGGIRGIADEVPLHPQWSPNELRRIMSPRPAAALSPFCPSDAVDFEALRQDLGEAWDRLVEALSPALDAIGTLIEALDIPPDNLDPLERANARRAQARAARERGLPSARRPPRSMRP